MNENAVRRGNVGLGATTGGGNRGSFAARTRPSTWAPPPPTQDPPAADFPEWDNTPMDFLPDAQEIGVDADVWARYVHARRREGDLSAHRRASQRYEHIPYEVREEWDQRANTSLNELHEIRADVSKNDPAALQLRDQALEASVKAALPSATGVRIKVDNNGIHAQPTGAERSQLYKKTPPEIRIHSRVASALDVAGEDGLQLTELAGGGYVLSLEFYS